MQQSKCLIHGNGKDKAPTGFMFEKQQMKGLYFNQSPAKVHHSFWTSRKFGLQDKLFPSRFFLLVIVHHLQIGLFM